MIEVEKKFILTDEQEKSLVSGAEFLGEKTFADVYYDDADFSLTRKDLWLRSRAGRFELKIPLNESIETRISDQYRELESDEEILNYFGVSGSNLNEFLASKRFEPFCEITTIRKKYKKEGFNMDLDVMDFGYKLAEIEFMTDDNSSLREATASIIAFAKRHDIKTEECVKGKVLKYLELKSPAHLQALIDAGVAR
jgi:adenylate cyclase class IV